MVGITGVSRMKVAWATDVHFDHVHEPVVRSFCERIRADGAEALLLGGDIALAGQLRGWLRFLAETLKLPIYFVLGNHDYYGSYVGSVHREMEDLPSVLLRWLPAEGVVALGDTVGLVGNGGWGDGRNGDFAGSGVVLADFHFIGDLRESLDLSDHPAVLGHRKELGACLRRLGEDAAGALAVPLTEAASRFPMVLVLTHVPPFPEASWHEGRHVGDEWLPFFTCRAIGDLLLEVAGTHPGVRFEVLCGHTHSGREARVMPNLTVRTGGATYGSPAYRIIESREGGILLH
jgi:hypothetical protein